MVLENTISGHIIYINYGLKAPICPERVPQTYKVCLFLALLRQVVVVVVVSQLGPGVNVDTSELSTRVGQS